MMLLVINWNQKKKYEIYKKYKQEGNTGVTSEQAWHEGINDEAWPRFERTKTAQKEAQMVVDAFNEIRNPNKKHPVISVITHEDRTVSKNRGEK